MRSSLKLKPQRSTRSFVGVVTLQATPASGLAASSRGRPRGPAGPGAGGPCGGAYVGAFMAQ